MSTAALQTHALVKRFGGVTATDHVSLRVEPGARHALIGPNGAGKTTLVDLLTGVSAPTSGRIELAGRDITRMPAHRRARLGLARTFQIDQLFAGLSVAETIALAVANRHGASRRAWRPLGEDPRIAAETAALLDRFGLGDSLHAPTAVLPYGKRRLLEIAIAIACAPRVLLLDEPLAGVPEGERAGILAALDELPAEVAILLIEHDMDIVFGFARRISVLVSGALYVEGTPEAIAADERVRAVYLGESFGG